MVNKIIKLLIVIMFIPLLSSCAGVSKVTTSATMQHLDKVSTIDATYKKDFSVSGRINDSRLSRDKSDIKRDVEEMSKQCSQVKTSATIMSKSNVIIDNLQTDNASTMAINVTFFDSPKMVNDSVLIAYSNQTNTVTEYLLKDALSYQWCKGYIDFMNEYNKQVKNEHSKSVSADLQYNINYTIIADTDKCSFFSDTECLAFHYKYNINVIDSKANKVYVNKNVDYEGETYDTVDAFKLSILGYYIMPIVNKNRDVIESVVFNDKLYYMLQDND